MTAFPTISVIVPTCGRRRSLERLLAALGRQTYPPDGFEVIVAVDGSADGTCEMLTRLDPPFALRWHWQPRHGRAAACNAGLSLAVGALVVLLDDDMEPPPRLLEAHAAAHPPGSRRVVIGAAPIVPPEDAPPAARFVARKFNRHVERLAQEPGNSGPRAFYSGNLSVRREVLDEVGGFDEEFADYGHEDVELWLRLQAAGVDRLFSTEALAYQHYEKDLRALAGDNLGKGRTAVLLAAKRPDVKGALKLAELAGGSRRRRMALGALVGATRVWSGVAELVLRAMSAAGRVRPGGLDGAYAFVLDYFFLMGAAAAARERHNGRTARA